MPVWETNTPKEKEEEEEGRGEGEAEHTKLGTAGERQAGEQFNGRRSRLRVSVAVAASALMPTCIPAAVDGAAAARAPSLNSFSLPPLSLPAAAAGLAQHVENCSTAARGNYTN